MSQPAANKRIDAGIPRGPRKSRPKPSDLEREERARARTGTFLPIHTPEQRKAVLDDALQALQQGLTTEDIGLKHGVSGQAVRTWLVAAGEEHSQARTIFYSRMQVRYLDQIETSEDPLALARAREGFSGWHKVAQVRDPKNFGQRLAVTNQELPSDESKALMSQAQELLTLFREKVVNPIAAPAALPEKPL